VQVRNRFIDVKAKEDIIRADRKAENKLIKEEEQAVQLQRQEQKLAKKKKDKLDMRAMFRTKAQAAKAAEEEQNRAAQAAADAKAGKKKKKDPNAPKGASTAYIHYSVDEGVNAKLKEANPDIKPCDMTKLKGVQWKALSEEEKKP